MSDEKDRYGDKLRDAEKAREDHFFANRDRELVQQLRAQPGTQEAQAVPELPQARCPRCGDRLRTRSQREVEIDECPTGHGAWLDAGQLEKLTNRARSGWLSRLLGRSS